MQNVCYVLLLLVPLPLLLLLLLLLQPYRPAQVGHLGQAV
jgi:hypothetical protein